jgi:hypothetical protein
MREEERCESSNRPARSAFAGIFDFALDIFQPASCNLCINSTLNVRDRLTQAVVRRGGDLALGRTARSQIARTFSTLNLNSDSIPFLFVFQQQKVRDH